MKQILLILTLFISIITVAQGPTPPGHTKISARYDWLGGSFKEGMRIPTFGTTPTTYNTATAKGDAGFDTAGNKFRIFDGSYWRMYPDSVYKNASDTTLHVRYGSTDINLGTMGGSGGGSSVAQNFPNIAVLRASSFYTTSGSLIANLQGYNAAGDGGGTNFYWDGTSNATDDGTFVIKPTGVGGGAGRWLKIFNGRVRALEGGIKNDGTDQTSNLNTLFSNATVKHVLFDNGDFKINGKVDAKGKELEFTNASRIVGKSGGGDTLTNGLIIADWDRAVFDTMLSFKNLNNKILPIKWFSAIAGYNYTVTGQDNFTPVSNAINAARIGCKVYINPTDSTDTYGWWYWMNRSIVINNQIEIYGERYNSVLIFNGTADTSAIKCVAQNTYIHDLTVRGEAGAASGYNANNAQGIYLSAIACKLDRVEVTAFDGDGVLVSGDVLRIPPTGASLCKIYDVHSYYNGKSGIHIKGGDANVVEVSDCNVELNGRFGIWDESFFGATITNIHSASNAGAFGPANRTYVTNSGTPYWCIQNNGPSSSVIQPGVTAGWQNYWQTGVGSGTSTVWNNSTDYFTGAGYYINGASQKGVLLDCYNEGDQLAQLGVTGGITINGFLTGAGVPMPYLTTSGGAVKSDVYYAALKLGVGMIPVNTLDVNSGSTQTIARLQNTSVTYNLGGDGNGAYIQPTTSSMGVLLYNTAGTTVMGPTSGGVAKITTVNGMEQNETAAPATPATNFGRWYVNSSDSHPHFINDGGTDYDLSSGSTTHGIDDVLAVGQTLTADRTITTQSGNHKLTISGNGTSNTIPTFETNSTGSGGLSMKITTSGRGLYIVGASGGQTPLEIDAAGTGFGLRVNHNGGGIPAYINGTYSNTNSIASNPITQESMFSTGTAAAGIGFTNDKDIQNSVGTGVIATQHIYKLTTTTSTSETGEYSIKMRNVGALSERFIISGNTDLTESSATTFASATVSTGKVAGGQIIVTIEANDGTDFQSRTQRFIWTAVNKAGTTTITLGTVEEQVAVSAGTLTSTITAVDAGGGVINFKSNAVSSLTQTTLRASYNFIKNF